MINGHLAKLIKHISFLIGLYFMCRFIFLIGNWSQFPSTDFNTLALLFVYGFRFDLSVIILTNSLFILLYLYPWRNSASQPLVNIALKWLFVIVNSIAISANLVDVVYYKYTLKRTTSDVFNFFSGSIGNDFFELLPTFLLDFWYLTILWILLLILIVICYKKVEGSQWQKSPVSEKPINFVSYLFWIAVAVIGYRGGLQLKPISPITAHKYATPSLSPIILNSTFTILKTLDTKGINAKTYFNNTDELQALYTTKRQYDSSGFFPQNVVLIVLESFSKEYIGVKDSSQISCTPFLDSIINNGFYCNNAFANGNTSMTGIASIIAGMPTWMQEPYITSRYGNNKIQSIANILKDKGYSSSFYHGGTNGTMGFDAFCQVTGYDHYYGRTEYNNESHYDGNWGIWDEEFLQFCALQMNKQTRPFFNTIFTLSSHHPYNIPQQHAGKFNKFNSPLKNSIAYTDYALRLFFNSINNQPWYKNTLFVFCADHTGITNNNYYANSVGNKAIPIIYYHPNNSLRGRTNMVTQQIDIMPSILDYLNYPNTFYALGNSSFDTTMNSFSLSYNNGVYQYLQNEYALLYDDGNPNRLYNYKLDSNLQHDLYSENTTLSIRMEEKVKAIIQTYNRDLINNTTHY